MDKLNTATVDGLRESFLKTKDKSHYQDMIRLVEEELSSNLVYGEQE